MIIPCLIQDMINNWPSRLWTPEKLAEILGNKEIKFRIGPKINLTQEAVWENNCEFISTSMKNFVEWSNGSITSDDTQNVLNSVNPETHWCYADYKYMMNLFEDQPNILQAVDWSCFGFSGRDGNDSTIWVGSQGANTPGHFDTYGFNLVAQLFGRKRWILFPPHQLDFLYPTRIPFEESSVFSEINIQHPDLQKHSKFKNSTPYIVTLNPGDVLFVPKHWWHFVECLETSISINSWIELSSDNKDRLHEALTRSLITGILSKEKAMNQKWLNHTEELVPLPEVMEDVNKSLNQLLIFQKRNHNKNVLCSLESSKTSHSEISKNRELSKRQYYESETYEFNDDKEYNPILKKCLENAFKLKPLSFEEYLTQINYSSNSDATEDSEGEITLDKLISYFIHPQVIAVVAEKLLVNFENI